MITDDDLLKIRGVIKEEIQVELKNELKPINRKLNRLKKDIAYVLNTHDEDIKNLRVRVDRLEKPPLKN